MAEPVTPLPTVLILLGPTAVGKTALSLQLAKILSGELVSADAGNFYRGLDIGTAKPSPSERAQVAHHLVDIANPDQTITLGEFQQRASSAIAEICQRGNLPILVGGSGLYVRAVMKGYTIPEVPPQPELRAQFEALAATHGAQALHERLAQVDPTAAATTDARNVRRVVRYLEVYTVTGKPISSFQNTAPPPYHFVQIGLQRTRADLHERIAQRIAHMLASGLLAEVQGLLSAGWDFALPAFGAIGYRQLAAHLRGETSLAESLHEMHVRSHHLLRQQNGWFSDPQIHWLPADSPTLLDDALAAFAK
jgi:tRNA dimethylallyltransferase